MFVDTHCHLNHQDFAEDLDEVLRRARLGGVERIMCAAYDLETSELSIELAERHPMLSASVGVHPHDSEAFTPETDSRLRELAGSPRVLAIGEAGLDYYRSTAPREVQQSVFRAHVRMAKDLGLPLIVHSREASGDVASILEEMGLPERGVVMHCFPGEPEFARRAVEMGCFLGIAGTVTFRNGQAIAEVARWAPADMILLETDAPYLSPHPNRGKRNEPSYIPLIAAKIAELRGIPVDELAEITTSNAARLFGPRFLAD